MGFFSCQKIKKGAKLKWFKFSNSPKFMQKYWKKISIVLLAVVLFGTGGFYYWNNLRSNLGVNSASAYNLNQKIRFGQDLNFDFPEDMNRQSVESNLILPTGFEGDFNWLDNRNLTLVPKVATQEGDLYYFTLQRSAKKLNGSYIGEDLVYRFEIAGAPEIVSHLPASDSTNISADSNITLIFDRPVAPLSAVQGSDSTFTPAGWSVTITPAIDGNWRWVGTTAVKFEPKDKLMLATKYTISIPAGISVQNNDQTDADFTFSFETERPTILTTSPEMNSASVGPNPEIQITFNQIIDLADLKSKTTLKSADKTYQVGDAKYYQYESKYIDNNGNEKTDLLTDEKVVVLTFSENLALDTNYTLEVAEGLRAKVGDLGTVGVYTLQFSTVGQFKINETAYQNLSLSVSFSNPLSEMDQKYTNRDLKQYFQITPEISNWSDVVITANYWSSQEVAIYANFNPSTDYTLTIDQGLTDAFGQKLSENYTFKFKTPELDPQVSIHSQNDFGVFEKNKTTTFYLNALNVSQLEIDFAKLSLEQLADLQKQRNEKYDAVPDLSKFDSYQHVVLTNDSPKNQWKIFPFNPFAPLSSYTASGIYVITVQAPEWKNSDNKQKFFAQQYFAVTETALTLKYSGNNALVWATNMQTGKPVIDAEIKFINGKGEAIITGKTDLDGFFEVKNFDQKKFETDGSYDSWNPQFWVTAQTANDFAFISNEWNNGLNPWNFSLNSDFRSAGSKEYRAEGYIYTDRTVYRAGDSVQVKGLVRLRNKLGQLIVPAGKEASVIVHDPDYNEVLKKTVKLSDFGSFNFEYPSAAEAMLGNYGIEMTLLPEEQYDWQYVNGNFQILAYKKPEYSVEVTFPQTDYYQGDTLKAEVVGAYYFGAPMSEADLTWRAQSTDYFFNRYTGDGWYSFALEGNWCWENCNRGNEIIAENKAKLNSEGKFEIKLPLDISKKAVSQVMTIEAEVTDPNNQVVANRASVIVHKSDVYVGIMPEQYIVTPDTSARVKLITLNPQGEFVANQKVDLTLYERTWNSIRKKNVDGEYYYENEPKDDKISDFQAVTNEKGEAIAEVNIPKGGTYRVLAKVKDDQNREAVADTSIYSWSDAYVNFAQPNSDKIEIIADKKEYKVGDTATLIVKSPYQGQGVKMLFTLERESILERNVIDLSSNAQPIKFKITEDMVPNIYTSALIIKPRQGETFDENGLDTGAPAFKMGYLKLDVETASKVLGVTIQTNAKKYKPREEVSTTITVVDAEGDPVQAEVSLSVVDMSVLALTGFQLPDLVARFYSERGLGVMTSQSLLYLVEYYKPGTKGGGGGEADSEARQNYKDTAYWNPTVLTDKNGQAQVKFTLPDNLTTWKLIAIAHDKSSDFGGKAEEIIETKDVILRSVKPRFALVGDEVKLGAIVHNFTDEDRNFEIKLTGTGFEMPDKDTFSVNIKPEQQTKVIFPVRITTEGEVAFDLKATSGEYSDHIFEKIPTYLFATRQVVATAGQTGERVHESVYTPDASEIKDGQITIKVAPTIATYLSDGLEYLINYPYGCAEQTASATWANWIAGQFSELKLLNLNETQIKKNITTGLAKIYDLQAWDGGFGYWKDSTKSNTYLTAYILSILNQIDSSDKEVRARAYKFLDGVLRSKDQDNQLNLATRVYILYTMSEFDKVDTGLLNNVAENYTKLPLFAKAELAMIYQNNGNTARAKEILQDVKNSALVNARGVHFDEKDENQYRFIMQDNMRTTAIVMRAMLHITPEDELLPNIARWLLNSRKDGIWKNTQTTSSVLVTLLDYLNQTKELDANFEAQVSVADQPSMQVKFNADNLLSEQEVLVNLSDLKQTQLIGLDLEKTGTGVLYYDILMDYLYTADEIAPTEQGLGIQSDILAIGSNDPKNLKVGQNYKIKLTMTVPEDRYFVGVESMLPAGFEPVDLSLQTSAQVDLDNELENNNWYFNHTEMRDDRVFLFADYLPAGVYEYEYIVRATTPGKFHQRPSRIWEMYSPENFGQTWGGWIEIKD